MQTANHRSTPPSIYGLLELRAAADLLTLPGRMVSLSLSEVENIGKGRTVFVLPGFGAGDVSMMPLRYYLQKHGFNVVGWGLGINKAGLDLHDDPHQISWDVDIPTPHRGEAGVPMLCDKMVARVKNFAEANNTPVSLVGWSLGGTIAREVARDLPDIVDQVVTLGSPIIGGPKYTKAAKILQARGLNLDWIEQEVDKRNQLPIKSKISAIVSKTDAIVDWSASVSPEDTSTKFIENNVSHLGMGINRSTMRLILEELR